MSLSLAHHPPIAHILREGRLRLGDGDPKRFPQPRMAELLGVSLRQYQRWERGSSHSSARAVERIERALAEEQAGGDSGIAAQVEALEAEIRALRAELDALRAQRG